MFQLLLESNAARSPRVGGSLFSTVAHMALVASAIALTAAPPARMREPSMPRARFIPVATPPVAPPAPLPQRAAADPMSAPSARGVPGLPAVIDIPLGLPTIELGLPVMSATEFGRGPRGRVDGTGAVGATSTGEAVPYSAEQVDKPVLMRPGAPVPTYPEMLRSAGIAGGVIVEFVVDTLGRVEPGSMNLLQADHALFGLAVRRVVPGLRFMPAEAQGRKVRQRVRLPFRFDLHS